MPFYKNADIMVCISITFLAAKNKIYIDFMTDVHTILSKLLNIMMCISYHISGCQQYMCRNIIRALLIGVQSISHVTRGRTCVSAGVDSPAGGHVTRPAGVPADVDRPAHGAQQL